MAGSRSSPVPTVTPARGRYVYTSLAPGAASVQGIPLAHIFIAAGEVSPHIRLLPDFYWLGLAEVDGVEQQLVGAVRLAAECGFYAKQQHFAFA
jgi:hypothetical protein